MLRKLAWRGKPRLLILDSFFLVPYSFPKKLPGKAALPRKRRYSTKKLSGKGPKEWRMCLGSCGRKFRTTIETRICGNCKKQNEKIEDQEDLRVSLFSDGSED